jgi:hypothetical protein
LSVFYKPGKETTGFLQVSFIVEVWHGFFKRDARLTEATGQAFGRTAV